MAKKSPKTTALGRAAARAILRGKAARVGSKEAREQAFKSVDGPRKLKKRK